MVIENGQERMSAAQLRKELGLPPADFAPIPGQAKRQADQVAAAELEVDKPKRRKFGNKLTWYNSPMNGLRRYDSQKEARRAESLDRLVDAGEVLAWWPQWQADCGFDHEDGAPVVLRIDFRIQWADRRITFEDVKGAEPTQAWRLKADAVRQATGIEIELV